MILEVGAIEDIFRRVGWGIGEMVERFGWSNKGIQENRGDQIRGRRHNSRC